MEGRELKGTTFEFPPFISEPKTNGSVYSGIEINILNAIAKSLNFTYTLSRPSDGLLWGDYFYHNQVSMKRKLIYFLPNNKMLH